MYKEERVGLRWFTPFSCMYEAREVYSLRKLRERSYSHGFSYAGSVSVQPL